MEPSPVDVSRGWSLENGPLFEEWRLHWFESVKGSEVYTEEDAIGLIEDLRTRIADGQAVLVAQQEQQAAFLLQFNNEHLQAGIANPMPKPEKLAKEQKRFSPL